MCTKRLPSRQRGLTMIELIVFVVIMGVAVSGMLAAMSALSASGADPLQRKQAMLRAEALLEEVALAKFTFCHPDDANAETAANSAGCATVAGREGFGPQTGETRPYFNINDYVASAGVEKSFNPADPAGYTVLDATGATMLPATGYQTTVSISPVTGFGPAGMQIGAVAGATTTADAEVLRIRVTVRFGAEKSGGGKEQKLVLERYRTRYAPNSMP